MRSWRSHSHARGFYRNWPAVRLKMKLPAAYLDYFINLLGSNAPSDVEGGRPLRPSDA